MQKAVAIVNTSKPESMRIAAEIQTVLLAKNVACDIYTFDGVTDTKPFDSCDFVITLGGDGTVLYAARNCVRSDKPIFPINLGEFGFIAGIEPTAWKEPLNDFLDGKINTSERMMLTARVVRDGKTVFTCDALNDAVISGSGIARIVHLSISFNGVPFGSYKADGIIVATPTGSTAYAAAAGGPILAPDLNAFVLAPICAFSLSNRPIVLPSNGIMNIDVEPMRHESSILTLDGQEVFPLRESDSVFIEQAPKAIRLIGCESVVFYDALKSKLNWSGTPVFSTSGGTDA